MDRIEQFAGEVKAALVEVRAAFDKGDKDEITKAKAKAQDLRAKYDAEVEMRELENSMHNVPPPLGGRDLRAVSTSVWAEVRKAMLGAANERRGARVDFGEIEERAITSNSSGINTAPGLVRQLVDGGKLGGKVSKFLGKNSQTVVDVFAPHLAVPVGSAEGATGTATDSTATATGQALTLKPWYSTLPISMGALLTRDIEAELPSIFQEAFGQAIDKAICVGAGSGNDMLGTFIASASGVTTSQDIACAAAGAPKWIDYVAMALDVLGSMNGPIEKCAIIVNPTVFKVALADTSAGTDPFRIEYLTKGTILGIPVVLSSYALTTLTAGSYVAVGGYFHHFALAIAQELTIDPIKTVGSDNITFQSFMYMQGKPLIGPSFRRLKTV